ncbi:COP23 domain-containing protein [Desmonostoc muscorum LEGE 12446]|nr:COP23 domain-containing protein [Desmonostoc muscorum]MCF2149506.1 COP23 domain-containing protein [Desmonostoc muscorum LEGE 12446]
MNNWQSWATMATAPILALGVIVAVSAPSRANSVQVTCKTNASTPKVILSLVKDGSPKDYMMLNFLPKYFSTVNAVQNCQNTAKTLQNIYDTDSSKYLTADKLNEQSVVCAVERRGIGCNHYSAQVLFILKPVDNPSQALYEMLGSDFKQAKPSNLRTLSRTYTNTKPFWWPF